MKMITFNFRGVKWCDALKGRTGNNILKAYKFIYLRKSSSNFKNKRKF